MGIEDVFKLLLVLVLVIYGFTILAFTFGVLKTGRLIGSWPEILIKPSTFQPGHTVSVIIPVRNEAGHILRILEEMRNQDFPVNLLEVIVVDDFSEDSSMAYAERFAKQFPEFPLVLVPSATLERKAFGKKRAIERAVTRAKGEIILCTDADTMHGSGWISAMAGGFGLIQPQMVLGPVVFCHGKNLLQKIQTLEFMGIMGTTAGSASLGYPVMCNGANLGYRRAAFIETGGYSGNLQFGSGDDQFLMNSIRKHFGQYAIIYTNDRKAIVSTEPEASLNGFLNQRLRWVSKSRGYRDPVVIAVGMVTWFIHFLLLGGMVLGIYFPEILVLSLALWLIKILLEYPMVWLMMRFFRKRELSGYYFMAQVFQLVYVVLVGMLGLFLPYRWKGRKG